MTTIYLIPSLLAEDATSSIPDYVMAAVKKTEVIFAENERTARRFLKKMDPSIQIDSFIWYTIHDIEKEQINNFKKHIQLQQSISIISEAGCPGIADPGQLLVKIAQELRCEIKPLVGPSSIFLALMASGFNGQSFEFVGYLPIDNSEKIKKIKELEISSLKNNSTKIFIETPYRNQQLFETIIQQCKNDTQLCIGKNITSKEESIITQSIAAWKKNPPSLHKIPVVFLIHA
jgi:16S rRNA (cytidine1402-2'-O)-methyltransferase